MENQKLIDKGNCSTMEKIKLKDERICSRCNVLHHWKDLGGYKQNGETIELCTDCMLELESDRLKTLEVSKDPFDITIELKCWPIYFGEILVGRKTFEVRKNDRDFQAGCNLKLREYDPNTESYTGSWVKVWVNEVYKGLPGVKKNHVIMTFYMLSADELNIRYLPELATLPF